MNAQLAEALTPLCPYCGSFSVRVTGAVIYPHRPDLAGKSFYACTPCGAWVGCHVDSGLPLGRLANLELRRLKQRVHAALDPLWMLRVSGNCIVKRADCYKWLAHAMGIPREECHIGYFDSDRCLLAFEVLRFTQITATEISEWAKVAT